MRLLSLPLSLIVLCGFSSISAPAFADGPPQKYRAKCAGCHGNDGKGNASAKPVKPHDLAEVKGGADAVAKAIRNGAKDPNGKELMKAFSPADLSDAQLKEIVDYVVSLQKK